MGVKIRDGCRKLAEAKTETSKFKKPSKINNMAPSTRSTARTMPPPKESKVREADTIKKTRFFGAWDDRHSAEPLRAIAADCDELSQ